MTDPTEAISEAREQILAGISKYEMAERGYTVPIEFHAAARNAISPWCFTIRASTTRRSPSASGSSPTT
jgi:hypothetical protein